MSAKGIAIPQACWVRSSQHPCPPVPMSSNAPLAGFRPSSGQALRSAAGDGKPLAHCPQRTAGGVSVPQPIERSPAPGASSLTTLHPDSRRRLPFCAICMTAYEADGRATRDARVAGLPMDQQTRRGRSAQGQVVATTDHGQADERSRRIARPAPQGQCRSGCDQSLGMSPWHRLVDLAHEPRDAGRKWHSNR